jgi:hypothetical protein
MGSARVFEDGTIDASSHKIEPTINARCVAIAGLIELHSNPDCIGVCIEEPFSGGAESAQAKQIRFGARNANSPKQQTMRNKLMSKNSLACMRASGPDQRHPVKAVAFRATASRLAALTGCRRPGRG